MGTDPLLWGQTPTREMGKSLAQDEAKQVATATKALCRGKIPAKRGRETGYYAAIRIEWASEGITPCCDACMQRPKVSKTMFFNPLRLSTRQATLRGADRCPCEAVN